jgi:hypothetical protein
MVDFAAAFKFLTTILTFIEGVVEQVAPLVNKFLDKKETRRFFHFMANIIIMYTSTTSTNDQSKLSTTSMW